MTSGEDSRDLVAVWGGVFHLLRHEEHPAGPVTICGLHLRETMDHDTALEHGLALCRWCGEDRG